MRITIPSAGVSAEIPFWVSVDTFLDEELDVSPITVENTNIPTPFPRFTVAVLEPDNEVPSYWMIGSDTAKTGPNGKTQHIVQLIEPTKWLERFIVGSKTVTQPLYVDYLTSPQVVNENFIEGKLKAHLLIRYRYTSPVSKSDKIPIYPLACFEEGDRIVNNPLGFLGTSVTIVCTVTTPNGTIKTYPKGYSKGNDDPIPDSWKDTSPYEYLNVDESGIYQFMYAISFAPGDDASKNVCIYNIAAVSAEAAKERTLKDAAESMILAAESLNESETPTFKLNPELAAYLDTITAPEITVTNATLREALDECAKYVDSITRLDVVQNNGIFEYMVDFEKYCKDEEADLSELGEPIDAITRSVRCDDYCTAFDATVDNMVHYEKGGTLFDPTPQFFRTPRSEDATYRVTEENAAILTSFPIERVDSLICRLYVDGVAKEVEMLPYLFESTEYGALSSYQTEYPFSKAYALRYTLGQKNITGLNFTVPHPVHEIFEKPAIVNIINRELGTNFSNLRGLDFTKLLFRVKYIPTGSLRVRMRKPNSYGNPESVLAYNQGAAKIDATAFGRAIFGAALRMGNQITTYRYSPPTGAHVPQKGERFGEDGYISEVHVKYGIGYKEVTIEVSEGFNRLSQFVGVDKSQRVFEISERLSLDRHIVYEDFCLIGTKEREGVGSIVTKEFLQYIKSNFEKAPLTPLGPYINGKGYDEDGNSLISFVMPAISYGIGNAITFTGSFEDNFGAGRRIDGDKRTVANDTDKGDIDESQGYYATQTDVRYTDLFGRIEKMELAISDGIGLSDVFDMSESDHLSLANALPQQYDPIEEKHTLLAYAGEGNRLLIDKDSRECIKTLTYQISFLEADGIKVSAFFAENMPFSGKLTHIRFVPLDHKISNITEYVVARLDDNVVPHASIRLDSKSIQTTYTMPHGGVAWAAVAYDASSQDGKHRFLFGKNGSFNAGETINVSLTFFRKKIKEKTN